MAQNTSKTDLYDEAAAVIQKAKSKEKSLKSIVYDSNSKNIRQLYALVCESLRYGSVIDKILENTAFLQKVPWMSRELALVLLYDFLFGKKLTGVCSGKYRKAVVKQKTELKGELQRLKEEKGVQNSRDLLPSDMKDEILIPRYVRVNLLKTSVDEVVDHFIRAGYTCVMTPEEVTVERSGSSAQHISCLSVNVARTLGKYDFAADLHLDDVLVFAAGTDFHNHPLYLTGDIILMDKASCFPAHLLSANLGSHVIDACAAPGNKTSHMASLLRNQGKIFAFDLDVKRLGVMRSLLDRAGVTCAETIHQDFLTSDPNSPDFSHVECIIVDPSCSGSGMANRKDYLVDESIGGDPGRLHSLQQLQIHILGHALSFPQVKRVVYSTCSVHREENEEVVNAVLRQREGFRLVPALCNEWDHRGSSENDVGPACLRASPQADATNGFFVALFERVTEEEGKQVQVEQVPRSCLPIVNGISSHDDRQNEVLIKKSKKRKRAESCVNGEAIVTLEANHTVQAEPEAQSTKKVEGKPEVTEDTDSLSERTVTVNFDKSRKKKGKKRSKKRNNEEIEN
ncbi:28S rRNA (cytosine-C(5))-methyltransferase-like [Diadema antillarum]|uniref:28S rRNA (cytosine-C(5))-methyltransferase-like n=1 Tax=Diadema antillarum TaxID=105358 RepID=UPI003A85949E